MGLFGFGKKKKIGGYVYVAESTRKDGSKKTYVGMTSRKPKERWSEHMSGKGGRFTSSGTNFRPIGALWSSNPRKAERTLKSRTPAQKRAFGRYAASKYKKRYSSW
jgi:predicted GIY-YIG superfamily endonuclease